MKVVLIEDERVAMRRLVKLIEAVAPQMTIIAKLESVFDAKAWFANTPVQAQAIDLILTDIQLSDGLSFEILDTLPNTLPIIFTTAYHEYALRAFKHNGVDYLLKPVEKEELARALHKFEQTRTAYATHQLDRLKSMILQLQTVRPQCPTFIAYQQEKFIPLACEAIAFFYTQNQIVYAVIGDKTYGLEETLEEIEKQVPSALFFRANRQFIIQKKFILNAEAYFNQRLLVRMYPKPPEDIIISREKATAFKNWLKGV